VKAEFLFDFGSPNAYIAHTQIPGIESRTGVTVEYVPVLLGGVFKLTGNVSPVEGYKPIPAKLEYFRQDIRDWVEHLGIPYRRNPHFPVMTLGIMRGAVALLGTDRFADYVETVFRAMWVEEQKMDDPAVIGEVLTAAGFDTEAIFARTREPEVKQKLIDLTRAAVDRGVFGSPAFFAGDRQFFGKDRMHLFEAAIVRQGRQFENLFRNLAPVRSGFPEEPDPALLTNQAAYEPAALKENLILGTPDEVIEKLFQLGRRRDVGASATRMRSGRRGDPTSGCVRALRSVRATAPSASPGMTVA